LLPSTRGRLAWPLNYWNGLAALMALGLPALLGLACSARKLVIRAAAAGAAPLLVLCSYLTFSRGGAIAGGFAVIAFILLSRERLFKLVTGLSIGASSTVLIAGAVHRSAIENGLTNARAQSQGRELLIAVVLVCLGTALAQAGIALAERHATLPRWTNLRPVHVRTATAGAVIVAIAIAVAAGGPSWLSHRWEDFKRPVAAGLGKHQLGRYGVASGNGRYQLWQVAVHAAEERLGAGWGPGTYALIYPPRAPFYDPVQNAHSLYLETFAEEGIPGLVLLVVFLGTILVGAVTAVVKARHESRTQAAAAAAACLAFLISAAVDWVWQLPVLPCAFLLLGAATLVPARPRTIVRSDVSGADGATSSPRGPITSWAHILRRASLALVALGCLFVIGLPLAETSALRASQAAAGAGATATALADAETAARLEPGAAIPQLQLALVLEKQDRLSAAVSYARRATADEPLSWSNWVVLSRLQAEDGHARLAVQAFRRARSLNPTSPLFKL
jgi:O-antigen ligase/polysaccharide polymerase Wzy-like membrane protein